jgi:hypothetical protein
MDSFSFGGSGMKYGTEFFAKIAALMEGNLSRSNATERELASLNLAVYQSATAISERLDRIIELLEKQTR